MTSEYVYGISQEDELQRLKDIIGDLRLYLMQFLLGDKTMTPERVRDDVILFLDEYRRLRAWASDRPGGITCGGGMSFPASNAVGIGSSVAVAMGSTSTVYGIDDRKT